MAEWVSVTILITGVNILAKDAVSFPTPTFGNPVFFPTFSRADFARSHTRSKKIGKIGKIGEKLRKIGENWVKQGKIGRTKEKLGKKGVFS